jgi:hypothetical protein
VKKTRAITDVANADGEKLPLLSGRVFQLTEKQGKNVARRIEYADRQREPEKGTVLLISNFDAPACFIGYSINRERA